MGAVWPQEKERIHAAIRRMKLSKSDFFDIIDPIEDIEIKIILMKSWLFINGEEVPE